MKTPMILETLNILLVDTVLIVVPSSLTFNWKKEIEQWTDLKAFVYNGTPKKREQIWIDFIDEPRRSALIVSKDTLKKDINILDSLVFDACIVDEAHYLRNYKTSQSKAIYKIQAKKRYALTGTPSTKNGTDVFGILHFLDPKKFSSYWQFSERYFIINDNHWGGKEIGKPKTHREGELLGVLGQISVKRTRDEVMKWLPKTVHQTIPLQMEGKQLKLYNDMLNDFYAVDGDTEIDTMNALAQLMRLRQICLDPSLLGFDAPSVKLNALYEFAEDNEEPFIVMSSFSSLFPKLKEELEKRGKKVGIISGKQSQKEKFQIAESFQKGNIDILLCNIIAAGTGFTLDRADTIVFLDRDFTPTNNEQAQDRIVPTTEERNHSITIIDLVCGDSIDERINEILENKEDLTQLINKGVKN